MLEKNIDQASLCKLINDAWDLYGLDNTKPLTAQKSSIEKFYNDSVWKLNAWFAENDPVSRSHRNSIANYLCLNKFERIADFGGGSGVLAHIIVAKTHKSIEVIEPYMTEAEARKLSTKKIKFLNCFDGMYDCIVAQDVLEHLEDPIDAVCQICRSIKPGGVILFANCFWPIIHCHLPKNFYLRYTFKYLMIIFGLKYEGRVNGASHVHIYRSDGRFGNHRFLRLKLFNVLFKPVGILTNFFTELLQK